MFSPGKIDSRLRPLLFNDGYDMLETHHEIAGLVHSASFGEAMRLQDKMDRVFAMLIHRKADGITECLAIFNLAVEEWNGYWYWLYKHYSRLNLSFIVYDTFTKTNAYI
ncbi:hypothetical protein GJ744_010759 [Endocarpon pusillum]|uniref:Uncharacterized protein n=1 Tax=Endocarpon pusillum TaxID=364733 RepID=A0A8H7E3H3_9EURO|nr:hypothetical protein GJ744_010759 [Endocarpon pusillum]